MLESKMRFIERNIGLEIKYNKKTGTYSDSKKRYTIAQCTDGDVEGLIHKLETMGRCGHKVICLDGIMADEDYKNAVENHIEVFDDDTIEEIERNIRVFNSGMNIPAMGYGALKIKVLNNIKESYAL